MLFLFFQNLTVNSVISGLRRKIAPKGIWRHIPKKTKVNAKISISSLSKLSEKKSYDLFLQNFTMNGNTSARFVRNDSENNNLLTVTCWLILKNSVNICYYSSLLSINNTVLLILWDEIFDINRDNNIDYSSFFHFVAHKCESCNTRYSDTSSLKRHLKKCAPHLIKEKPGGPFKCPHPHCQRGLFTVRGWLTHKSSHTDLIHDCEYNNCTESFRSAAEIQNHIKTVHAHELQNFQCDYDNCSRSFPLKYLLDAHTDRHKRQTEHLCTECGKVCLTSCGLSAHMKNAHRYLKKILHSVKIRNLYHIFRWFFLPVMRNLLHAGNAHSDSNNCLDWKAICQFIRESKNSNATVGSYLVVKVDWRIINVGF